MVRSSSLREGNVRLSLVDQPLFVSSGESVCLCVASADVIHCYSVPGLGVKVDAIPGRVSCVGLRADSAG
jgi:heme/copper-type cytochrome/quinol oxidase subunit 2